MVIEWKELSEKPIIKNQWLDANFIVMYKDKCGSREYIIGDASYWDGVWHIKGMTQFEVLKWAYYDYNKK